jgi:hypothetical protein
MTNTVVQCSYCGGLSSLDEFPRSIIGKKCDCGGINMEINYDDRKPASSFTEFYNKKLLADLNIAEEKLKKIKNERNKLYKECYERGLIK